MLFLFSCIKRCLLLKKEKLRFLSLLGIPMMLVVLLITACTKKDTLIINTKQPSFTITLPSNPTTGFLWTVVDYDKNLFLLTDQQYITSNSGLIGAGGHVLFTFKLKKQAAYPSYAIIKLKNSRSWEPQSAMQKQIKIIIKTL